MRTGFGGMPRQGPQRVSGGEDRNFGNGEKSHIRCRVRPAFRIPVRLARGIGLHKRNYFITDSGPRCGASDSAEDDTRN